MLLALNRRRDVPRGAFGSARRAAPFPTGDGVRHRRRRARMAAARFPEERRKRPPYELGRLRELVAAFGLDVLAELDIFVSIELTVPVPMPVTLAISDAVMGPPFSASSTWPCSVHAARGVTSHGRHREVRAFGEA